MTRYQACRSIGLDPVSAGFVTFIHFMAGAPEGKIGILHMNISYDPAQKYKKGMTATLEENK